MAVPGVRVALRIRGQLFSIFSGPKNTFIIVKVMNWICWHCTCLKQMACHSVVKVKGRNIILLRFRSSDFRPSPVKEKKERAGNRVSRLKQ